METYYLKLLVPAFNKRTLFNKLPNDIIEYIITYIYSEMKQKNIQKIIPSLKLKGIKSRLININKLYDNYRNLYILPLLYLRHKIYFKYIEDPEYFINVLNTCECCEYHKIIKPKSLYTNMYNNSFTISYYNSCQCKCNFECILIYNTFTYNLNVL
jgi:hypothetical protein